MVRHCANKISHWTTSENIWIKLIFFRMAQQPNSVLGRPTFKGSRSHTHTRSRAPLSEWSARRRGHFLHNTQITQETNTHAFSEIRTSDPSNQATADMRLRRRGHRDRLTTVHVWPYLQSLNRSKRMRTGQFIGFITDVAVTRFQKSKRAHFGHLNIFINKIKPLYVFQPPIETIIKRFYLFLIYFFMFFIQDAAER